MLEQQDVGHLISPYGGELVNLLVEGEERQGWIEKSRRLPVVQITPRSLCDLELLATGAFSPLTHFMGRADYQRVLHEMRLQDGTLFPIPVTLPLEPKILEGGVEQVVLCDARNNRLAVMQIEEVYEWNAEEEAQQVLGTTDLRHPLVSEIKRWGKVYASGPIKMLELPRYHDFTDLRRTPAEVRKILGEMEHENVVAFQTRNPVHRIHEELTKRAAKHVNGSLLIHPVVGMTKPGDIDHFARVRIYRALAENYYDTQSTLLSLLPLAVRMAGPREAIWHAPIRRNYGATHFIIGRDHAGPGQDSHGKPFYEPYAAQTLLAQYALEIGVQPVEFKELVYLPDADCYEEAKRFQNRRRFSLFPEHRCAMTTSPKAGSFPNGSPARKHPTYCSRCIRLVNNRAFESGLQDCPGQANQLRRKYWYQ